MNIIRLAFELFLLYLLYKLVFEFIIPVYKTTKRIKKQMGDMQQKMHEQQSRQDAPTPQPHKRDFSKDYIEYEEVK